MINRFLLLALLLVSYSSSAQCVVSGHVLDAKTKAALPFATIIDLEANLQTAADEKGLFQLEGSCGQHVLQIQFLGYEPLTDTVVFSNDAHFDLMLRQSAINIQTVTISEDGRTELLRFVPMAKLVPAAFTTGLNQHAAEIFSSSQGVSSINTGTSSGQPVIRGLYGSRVGIIVDGVPQQNQQWGLDHGLDLDPWLIHQFAVHKTGAGVLFGPSASAGAIEIETTPACHGNHANWVVNARGLSATQLAEGAISYSKCWKNLQLFAVGSARSYADYRVPADTFSYLDRTFPLQDGRLVNTSGKANGQQIGAVWRKNLRLISFSFRRTKQEFGIFPGIFGIPSTSELEGDGDQRSAQLPLMMSSHSIATLNITQPLIHAKVELTAAYQLSEREERGQVHSHGSGPIPTSDLALGLRLRTMFFDLAWTEYDLKKFRFFLKTQVELQESTSAGWEFLLSDYQRSNFGVTGGVKVNVWDGQLHVGVRTDYNRLSVDPFWEWVYDEDGIAVDLELRGQSVTNQFLMWSVNTNYSKYLSKGRSVEYLLSRSVRSPNAYETAANGVHHGTFRHEKGNAALTPEVGYIADFQFANKGNWLINPFIGYYSNFIFLAPAAQFSTLPEAGQLYQFEQSEVVRFGAEMVIEKSVQGYDFELSGAYVNGRVINEGTALPWTPPLRVSGMIKRTWNLRKEGHEVYISPRVELYSAQNEVFRNEDPTPGYQLVNGSMGYRVNMGEKSLQIIAFISNALNTTYINHMSRYKLLNLPEVGRNVGINLNLTF